MRRIHVAGALGLLLLTTACGTAATNSGGPDIHVRSTVVSKVAPPPSVSMLPPTAANRAAPDPAAVDLHPVRWDRATPGPGATLDVQYTAGGRPECAKLGRVDVKETDTVVTVAVLLGHDPGVDCTGPQPMIAASFQTTVVLTAPLGSRAVN